MAGLIPRFGPIEKTISLSEVYKRFLERMPVVAMSAGVDVVGCRYVLADELLTGRSNVDRPDTERLITSLSVQSGGGLLIDNCDGTWTYTPDASDHVTFAVTGSDGTRSIATIDLLATDHTEAHSWAMAHPRNDREREAPEKLRQAFWNEELVALAHSSRTGTIFELTAAGWHADGFAILLFYGSPIESSSEWSDDLEGERPFIEEAQFEAWLAVRFGDCLKSAPDTIETAAASPLAIRNEVAAAVHPVAPARDVERTTSLRTTAEDRAQPIPNEMIKGTNNAPTRRSIGTGTLQKAISVVVRYADSKAWPRPTLREMLALITNDARLKSATRKPIYVTYKQFLGEKWDSTPGPRRGQRNRERPQQIAELSQHLSSAQLHK